MRIQKNTRFAIALGLGIAILLTANAVDAQTHDHGKQDEVVKAPKIFLDKKPRIVKFQLKRLDNSRLLLVERKDDDPKYLLVHQEILMRNGMARGDQAAAIKAIAKINESDVVIELLNLIPTLDEDDKKQNRVIQQLTNLLFDQPRETISQHLKKFSAATESKQRLVKKMGYAGLLAAGNPDEAFAIALDVETEMAALLESITMLPSLNMRNSVEDRITYELKKKHDDAVMLAGLKALATTNADPAASFDIVAPFVSNPKLRRAAVKVMLKTPREDRDKQRCVELAEFLVKHAETTPASDRTSDEFVEAMQLANQILGLIPKDKSDAYRKRLGEVTVRVVLIHSVEEEMRYDIPWFAVEAGRDIQIVLKNEDLMAHNLVITKPEALQEVALLAAADGPKIGASGKQYVPASDKVLYATEMVQAEKQARLTFKAPTEPGEYPYVCTFPGHWMRMYGVMVVVNDLSEFERNPVEPKDPVGSNRPIVKAWTSADFPAEKIANGLRGRNPEIGKKIFNEATCALCHKIGAEGKEVGPDLTDVWSRWKDDAAGVLGEVIDPSHKIEAKYIVRKIMTLDGDVISGIVLSEDKDSISILQNPESPEATVIAQDDIDDMVKSSVSIMPKGLMDRFTEDEIFELLAYLKTVGAQK